MTHQPRWVRSVAVALTFVMTSSLAVGCGGEGGGDEAGSRSTAPAVQANPFTGRELYQGMFFGAGRAAVLFPEVWSNERLLALTGKSGRNIDLSGAAQTIAAQVDKQDPAFFPSFEAALRSHDHVRIAQALAEARRNTEQAVQTLKNSPTQVMGTSGKDNGLAVQTCVSSYVAVEIAVLVEAVAVIAVVAFWLSDQAMTDASALTLDRWVDTLAHKDFDFVPASSPAGGRAEL